MSTYRQGSLLLPGRNARAERGPSDITFGPVPSRRLGRSLGINNMPPGSCSYSCVYCQAGRTARMRIDREPYHPSSDLATTVRARVQATLDAGEHIDVLTFVPDGEPTLDLALGHAIRLLRPLGIPIAVFTNASLLTHLDVWADLDEADLVSVKVDAVREETWRRVNRPHRRLELADILLGMRTFARGYSGTLLTETMLVEGVNDGEDEVRAIADFVADLGVRRAYLAVPTRPPAEPWVRPAGEAALARAYELFRTRVPGVEMLLGYEGDAFISTGDAMEDLLGVTTVHPMREGAVRRMLERAGVPWSAVARLVRDRRLVTVRYGSHRYYLRPVAVPPPRAREDADPPDDHRHGRRV